MYTKRRSFILGSCAFAAAHAFSITPPSGGKLRIALIGCGRRMKSLLVNAIGEKIVAMADPDPLAFGNMVQVLKTHGYEGDISGIKCFARYRDMLEKMSGEIDAAIIASTNLHHAPIAIAAMEKGIHVYVEKPMAYSIGEAKAMRDAARKYGVATQVGTHGHNDEGVRRYAEYLASGVLGDIKEVWSWSNRVNAYAVEPPRIPVPEGFDWGEYRGTARDIEYRKEMHPHGWHAWKVFGNGSIGNMGAHVFDPLAWGLGLVDPESVEMVDNIPGGEGSWDLSTELKWEFAATAKRGPVTLHWFDGVKAGVPIDEEHVKPHHCTTDRRWMNKPPAVAEIEKEYGVDLGESGSVIRGSRGIIHVGASSGLGFVPSGFRKELGDVPKIFPRERHLTHMKDFFIAARGGRPAACNFEYSTPLTGVVLSGNLASLAGRGKKIAHPCSALAGGAA